jgi:hypothetical protein
VQSAFHNMAPLKALSPDGFLAEFFQKNWNLVREDICSTIIGSLNIGILLDFLNMTHIALIPKLKNPITVSDYRPTSLCNIVYKLLSKVLANRLKKILPYIISPVQSVFVPRRLITDNVLAAYETFHTVHTRIKGRRDLWRSN